MNYLTNCGACGQSYQEGDCICMSYSDDQAEFWFTGIDRIDRGTFVKPVVRKACKHCGHSNIRGLAAEARCPHGEAKGHTAQDQHGGFFCNGPRGWAFECRRCGMDSWFTDKEVEAWSTG